MGSYLLFRFLVGFIVQLFYFFLCDLIATYYSCNGYATTGAGSTGSKAANRRCTEFVAGCNEFKTDKVADSFLFSRRLLRGGGERVQARKQKARERNFG